MALGRLEGGPRRRHRGYIGLKTGVGKGVADGRELMEQK